MTQRYGNTGGVVLVAIDIAKKQNAVLIQFPDGTRKKLTVTNSLTDYRELSNYLKKLKVRCKIDPPPVNVPPPHGGFQAIWPPAPAACSLGNCAA
jgi:hypothetical protein